MCKLSAKIYDKNEGRGRGLHGERKAGKVREEKRKC